jgi:hypothetical protein
VKLKSLGTTIHSSSTDDFQAGCNYRATADPQNALAICLAQRFSSLISCSWSIYEVVLYFCVPSITAQIGNCCCLHFGTVVAAKLLPIEGQEERIKGGRKAFSAE